MTAVGASTLAPLIEHSIVAFVEQTTRFLAPAFIGDTIHPEHEVVGPRAQALGRAPDLERDAHRTSGARSSSKAGTAT